jgi:hypothetical protein
VSKREMKNLRQNKSLISRFDQFIFLKNGFSFWKHLIPFSIAALLLLVLSLPVDNLLLKLVDILESPSWVWMPAGLLTVVAFGIYFVSIYVQVRQAYLRGQGILRRSITTTLLYVLICSTMAFAVLATSSTRKISWGIIWACFLLSVLSLTGIGWSGPDKWVELLGIVSPDYTKVRYYARDLEDLLTEVRNKEYGIEEDVKEFIAITKKLKDELKKNKNQEPEWARIDIETVIDRLQNLVQQTERYFPINNKVALEDFVSACNFQMDSLYPDFIEALKTVNNYLIEWRS